MSAWEKVIFTPGVIHYCSVVPQKNRRIALFDRCSLHFVKLPENVVGERICSRRKDEEGKAK
jgi:hypothetical protein